MKIQVNVSQKTLMIFLIICLVGLLIDGMLMVLKFHSTKDYVPVEAEITETIKRVKPGFENNTKKSRVKYIQYKYSLNEASYETKVRTFVLMGKNEGDKKIIYVNAKNPTEIRDSFTFEIGAVFLLIFGFFEFFCIAALRQIRRESEY